MRKVREILRLTYDAGLPSREVGRQVGVGSAGVRVMLQRFRASVLEWPLPEGLTDTALEVEFYGVAATKSGQRDRPEPDWAAVNREMKRKHVTLQVLWDEYIAIEPGGYRYSRFCEFYRTWEGRLPVTMQQTYLGGDRLFVDYAGDTVPVVVDRLTGEIRQAHLFVAKIPRRVRSSRTSLSVGSDICDSRTAIQSAYGVNFGRRSPSIGCGAWPCICWWGRYQLPIVLGATSNAAPTLRQLCTVAIAATT